VPPPGDVERRVTTQLVAMGRADSAVAVAARRLARMIDGAVARGDDDVAVAHEALDGLMASALTWGDRPPPDELTRARARRRGYVMRRP
jgi:hypothetical protein